MFVSMFVCVCVFAVDICAWISFVLVCVCACMYMCMYVCMCMFVCVCVN